MVIAKKYVVNSPFRGMPKKSDFTIVEEELPGLNENGKHFLDVYPQGHIKPILTRICFLQIF